MSRRRVKPLPETSVRVSWDTATEKVAATSDHAMMVLLDGDADPTSEGSAHRVYFSGTPLRQAQMAAAVIDYALQSGLWAMTKRILTQNPAEGEQRGAGEKVPYCPHCGHMKET